MSTLKFWKFGGNKVAKRNWKIFSLYWKFVWKNSDIVEFEKFSKIRSRGNKKVFFLFIFLKNHFFHSFRQGMSSLKTQNDHTSLKSRTSKASGTFESPSGYCKYFRERWLGKTSFFLALLLSLLPLLSASSSFLRFSLPLFFLPFLPPRPFSPRHWFWF